METGPIGSGGKKRRRKKERNERDRWRNEVIRSDPNLRSLVVAFYTLFLSLGKYPGEKKQGKAGTGSKQAHGEVEPQYKYKSVGRRIRQDLNQTAGNGYQHHKLLVFRTCTSKQT